MIMMGVDVQSMRESLAELDDRLSKESHYNEGLCRSCGRVFRTVCKLFKFKEFTLPIVFFLVQGILIPNFDDIHYDFLTDHAGMSKSTYDYLNIILYVSILLIIYLVNQCFNNTQIWILVLVSLCLFVIMTSLMLVNALRINEENGVSDAVINGFIFFLGTGSVSVIAFVPTQV